MEEQLLQKIEQAFSAMPCTAKTIQLKSDMTANITAKYKSLISAGMSEEAAFDAAASDLNYLSSLGDSPAPYTPSTPQYNEEEYQREQQKNALLTAVAVALYIMSIIPCIIFQNGAGEVVTFIIVAIATAIIIYKTMSKKGYKPEVAAKAPVNEAESGSHQLYKAVSSALWVVIVAVYLVVSFSTSAWYITWIIFPLGGAIEGIIKAVIDLVTVR